MRDFLWNFAMLSLFMGGLILLLRLFSVTLGQKIRARTRYLLWIFVLLRMCLPFLLPVPAVIEIPVGDVERYQIIERVTQPDGSTDTTILPYSEYTTRREQGVYGDDMTEKLQDGTLRIGRVDLVEILPVVWLIGAAAYLAVNLGGYWYCMTRLRYSFSPASEELCTALDRIGADMGLRKVPRLSVSDRVHSPMLCGIVRPRIVLPIAGDRIGLTEEQTAGILAHELTHYRRKDLWIKLTGILVCTLHWFNPFMHLADRWMNEEMELSCDETVLSGQSAAVRSAYGNGMLSILRQCRKQRMPMTTHFSPRKQLVKMRFENIMDTSLKKRGTAWVVVVLALCLLAGSAVACVQDRPAEISPVHLDLSFEYTYPDSLVVYGAEQNYTVPGAPVPVFVNGSCLTVNDRTAYVSETPTLRTDLLAVAHALYPNAGLTSCVIAFSEDQCNLSYRMDKEETLVEIRFDTGAVLRDGKKIALSAVPERQYTGSDMMILLPPEDIALLLDAEVAVLFTRETVYGNESDEPYLFIPFGDNALLYDIPHIQFWRYPDSAVALTPEEALQIAEDQLILAYEASFGPFTPLEEEPDSSPYPGDELYFRWQIPHLTITGETDRFYRIAFVWDLLIDKYTGEVYTHYNGLAQSFHRFVPEFPAALAFAG